ncbi:MAG: SusC/RagA family protein, partial [Bacteroidales bacterium]|nr:SusC/RagA family protein [Bacteroidales bacterium]
YKNVDLSFYFYYNVGGQVYNYDYAANMHDGTQPGNNLASDAGEAWTPNNRYTNVPRYVVNSQDGGNQMSTRFLEDASYLRLKNITLSYQLPESACKRIKMKGLRMFVSGENLWTVTGYKGFDPEGALNGTTSNSIPGTKVFTFGLKMDL